MIAYWFFMNLFSLSFWMMLIRQSLTLLLLKILMKSGNVIFKSVLSFSCFVRESRAVRILRANSEFGASPRLTSGLIISVAESSPEPSSSHDRNRSFANSMFFLCVMSVYSSLPWTLCLAIHFDWSLDLMKVFAGMFSPNLMCAVYPMLANFSSMAS